MRNGKSSGETVKVGVYVRIFQPRRSGYWYLRWNEPVGEDGKGRVVERSTGHTNYELAVHVAKQKDDELERARLNGTAKYKPRRTLVDHAVRKHLNDLEDIKRSFEHRKKTRQRLTHFCNDLKSSGIRYLDEVTTRVIQDYLNTLAGRLVPRSVKNYATTITGWLNACVTSGWMSENPASIGKRGKLKLPEEPEARRRSARRGDSARRVPTREEYSALLAACDEWTADAVRLMANTGIRYGELMFLTVDDVDFDGGTLTIGYKELPYQMPKTVRQLLKDPSRGLWWSKDATDRVLPLTRISREVLKKRTKVAEQAGIPWLFANTAGHPRAHNKALDRLKTAAVSAKVMMNGEGESRLGWHTLRRYFVSIASTCMSLPSVMESAGHDSTAMWELYRETDHDSVREDFERLDEATGDPSSTESDGEDTREDDEDGGLSSEEADD